MEWISVDDYRPGKNPVRCLYKFDDGSYGVYLSSKFPVDGVYLAEDGEKEKKVTHWLIIPD